MHIPLALYIHMPWCIRKCPYCDFNSHAVKNDDLPEQAYINALLDDLQQHLEEIDRRPIHSIFIGGGTPSLISAAGYDTLFNTLQQKLTLTTDCEITLEANPGSVEQQRFRDYRQIGINRISLGIQSFQDDKLKALGRIHNSHDAKQAIETAQNAGFSNFNIDLMFGLPQQSIADAQDDLTTAIALQPTHLSWYQLTIEPNTFFYKHTPRLPADDFIWQMQQLGLRILQQHGYTQYEVSAYSKPDLRCQHNLNYWQFGDYLGIGAGAHSKLSQASDIFRYSKFKHPKHYLDPNKPYTSTKKIISPQELPLEFMLNALRLTQATTFDLFKQRTGLSIHDIEQAFSKATAQGLLSVNNNSFQTTGLGQRFLNELLELFIAA